ncbi:tryptophan synthase subunit beta [candidate division GN15 bacterium]|uniref:Tryptophan synthase beta chain n=1 Tax=candidate division GN15 bacterium TaxID=2072418 RepID=A0A855X1U7_9BACT|nr:MAG: tryptophan synthase subunit beta [candidate division GN15 bacterium]
MTMPDRLGFFGDYGGRYVPETLVAALDELEAAFRKIRGDRAFSAQLRLHLRDFAGRPTPLYLASNISHSWGAKIYLKREDLTHTGAHKINNTVGQALLTRRLGKRRVIAETGAGQHGVATAAACSLLGLRCRIYMGAVDVQRQRPNVLRMHMLGAEVVEVKTGSATLKDACNEAIRDWVTNVDTTHYIIGSTIGPHPYPLLVRHFQSIIGREANGQIRKVEGRLPDAVFACVGGGSNALGIFHGFLGANGTRLFGVESAGHGLKSGLHAATLAKGTPGVLHGSLSYLLQSRDGQITPTETLAAGLDYPGVGPEHSYLKDSKQVTYTTVTDHQAVAAFRELSRREGIIPALESSYALAAAREYARRKGHGKLILVNLSGRGDKDLDTLREYEEHHH